MDMQIHVGMKDIEKGVKGMSGFCPVALAIKRRIPGRYVHVGVYNIRIGSVRFRMSGALYRRIRQYDSGLGMRPFRATLPESVDRMLAEEG